MLVSPVISITDGQIYLEPGLFYAGIRPAINAGLSVSRVGSNAQIKPMKDLAGSLRLELAQYRELEAFAKFGSELDAATLKQLKRGQRLIELLKQPQYKPLPVERQIALLYLGTRGYLDEVPVDQIVFEEEKFYSYIEKNHNDVFTEIKEKLQIDKHLELRLDALCEEFLYQIASD